MKFHGVLFGRVLVAVLLSTPVSWGQTFGDQIQGVVATKCGGASYDPSGAGRLTESRKSSCNKPKGSASASSAAYIGPPSTWVITKTTGQQSGAGASSTAWDTVTLNPPSGFSGNQVSVTLVDTYAATVKNFTQGTFAQICWTVPGLLDDCVTEGGDTHGVHTVKYNFTVSQVMGNFDFEILQNAVATSAVGSVASLGDTGVKFLCPTSGWTYTFASAPGTAVTCGQ